MLFIMDRQYYVVKLLQRARTILYSRAYAICCVFTVTEYDERFYHVFKMFFISPRFNDSTLKKTFFDVLYIYGVDMLGVRVLG